MTFLILCTAVLSRLFGQEDPCGIVVCTPRRILSPLVGPLSCSLDVSTLHHSRRHRRAGVWGRARRVSARGSRGAWTPGALSDPSFFPHTRYSGHSAGDCVETLWTWRVSIRLTARDVFTAWHRSCPRACACAASVPFSPSAPQPPHLPPYGCTSTSSFASLLLMEPYLFLTLNPSTAPQTFLAMSFSACRQAPQT